MIDAGKPVHLKDQEFVIEPSGTSETRYLTATYAPLRDEGGTICGELVIALEVTQRVLMERENQALLEATRFADDQLRQMFEQAPNFIMVLKGADHVCEIINAACRQLVGGRGMAGKSVLQALPEVEAQGLIKLLDGVYQFGETFVASNRLVSLAVPNAPDASLHSSSQDRYLDFVYQPIRNAQGQVCGIFCSGSGSDVTGNRQAQLELSSNVQRLQAPKPGRRFSSLWLIACGHLPRRKKSPPLPVSCWESSLACSARCLAKSMRPTTPFLPATTGRMARSQALPA